MSDILDFYLEKLPELKAKRQEYKYTKQINDYLSSIVASAEQQQIRHNNLQYIKKFSPWLKYAFAPAESVNRQGAFIYKNHYFIMENWAYSVVGPEESFVSNPYIEGKCSINECIGIRKILNFFKQTKEVGHVILKLDAYAAVRLADLDAALDIINFSELKGSYYNCRFLDYNKIYTSFMDALLPITNLAVPTNIVTTKTTDARFARVIEACSNDLKIGISDRIVANTKIIKEHYHDDFCKSITEKIKDKSLKILLITSSFSTALQYFTRDMEEGFKSLGYQTVVLKEQEGESTGVRSDVTTGVFASFKPDIAFQIDYFRYAADAYPRNIPFVTWIQDMLSQITSGEHLSKINNKDIILAMCFQKQLSDIGYRQVYNFPVHVNDRLFSGSPENVDYLCDLSMINHFTLPVMNVVTKDKDLSNDIHNYLKPIFADDPNRLVTIDDYVKALKKKYAINILDVDHRLLLESVMVNMGNYFCRGIFADWAVATGKELHIYGNSWDQVPRFKRFAKGPLENGKTSSEIYNRTKINLHSHTQTTTHPRVFEAIASGGFLLIKSIGSRDSVPINDLLPEGSGYVFVHNRNDFLKKVRHYLNNPQERIEIIKKGQKEVLSKFTVKHGAEKVLQILKERFS